jgi:hypothetical protein
MIQEHGTGSSECESMTQVVGPAHEKPNPWAGLALSQQTHTP